MRHAKKGRKLGSDASHRKAMLRSLATAILANERIKTTEARAKEVRPVVDRVITWGKKGDVHSRRLALAEIGDKDVVHKVFDDIASRFDERDGGYTRILKLGPRKGDSAPMVIIELVD
jgi:large subunit ribosomal protein L17